MSAALKHLQQQLSGEKEEAIPEKQPFVHSPLVVSCKGKTHSIGEILDDCLKLIPHAKKDNQIPEKEFKYINEICKDKHCDTIALFQTKHKMESYLWLAAPEGPTMCLYIEEGRSMYDLALVGNAMKGSRPIIIFDKSFEQNDVFQLAKVLLARAFEVPNGHKKSKPFVDRTMSFFVEDGKIVIRHYQVLWEEEGASLAEIGPRITLVPAFVKDGCFTGREIWTNKTWQSPYSAHKEERKNSAEEKAAYRERRAKREERRSKIEKPQDPHKGFFAKPN